MPKPGIRVSFPDPGNPWLKRRFEAGVIQLA
jgi:hypothetical protein